MHKRTNVVNGNFQISTPQHRSTQSDFINVVTLGKLNTHSTLMAEITTAQIGITTASLRAFSTLMHWEMGVIAKAIGTTERILLRNKLMQVK